MAVRFNYVLSNTKQLLNQKSLNNKNQQVIPKGHIPIYVGDQAEKMRYVVPLSCLSHPLVQDLLDHAEEEFGFDHPMGGFTIPCTEDAFIALTSELH